VHYIQGVVEWLFNHLAVVLGQLCALGPVLQVLFGVVHVDISERTVCLKRDMKGRDILVRG
jgi:di/tricarboxylate transporter